MTADEPVNILLVDDQPTRLLTYETILQELGERLIRAGSAREALEHLLRTEVAVVVSDVVMPDLDGYELAALIRGHPRFERTAIIFVSGAAITDPERLRGYEVGAVDYLPVPIVPELLRAKVRVFADLYRKTRQLEALNAELEGRVAERTAELERANAELERRVEERTREREAALAQVHEMQKLESLGKLTGGVAHDFNNLLMAVLGNLNLIRKHLPADPRLRRWLDGAVAGAERGATLTRRMLAFARRQELKPSAVNVARLVDEMTELMRHSLGPGVEIVTEGLEGLPPVRVDPNGLELALLNLAVNARDAMPGGGRLTIAGRPTAVAGETGADLRPGRYVALVVADTGTGMDAATLRRATEPFFTTKGVGRGTGLGLSTVHGLAAQSGGALRITSRRGTGTAVEIWLPVAGETDCTAQTAEALTAASAPASRRCRVLLVDDDPLVRTSTAEMLEDLGHAALEASSGEEAFELLRAGAAVDVVVTDHAMPGMTGVELAAEIGKGWPGLPVLLVTGYADLPDGEALGLPTLAKPYRPEELDAALGQLLDTGTSREPVRRR